MLDHYAREYIGVPWKHQGRSRLGIDCIGLVVVCARSCGLAVRDRTDYGRDPDGTILVALAAHLVPSDGMSAGDVALLEYARGIPRHVGIIGEQPEGLSLIHADSRAGKVVEHLIDARWRRRIVGVWRLP